MLGGGFWDILGTDYILRLKRRIGKWVMKRDIGHDFYIGGWDYFVVVERKYYIMNI
jgi:hypothetical protein